MASTWFGKAGYLHNLTDSSPTQNVVASWIDEFVEAIENNEDPVIDGHQGFENLLFINSVYRSIEEKSVINLNYE